MTQDQYTELIQFLSEKFGRLEERMSRIEDRMTRLEELSHHPAPLRATRVLAGLCLAVFALQPDIDDREVALCRVESASPSAPSSCGSAERPSRPASTSRWAVIVRSSPSPRAR